MNFDISVIIPAYNPDTRLIDAINSVLLISGFEIELIIIDDFSTTEISELLSGYITNPSIRLVRNKMNYGVSFSRNLGLKIARGNYIAFLDADDVYLNNRFDFLRDSEFVKKFSVFFHNTLCVDKNGDYLKYYKFHDFQMGVDNPIDIWIGRENGSYCTLGVTIQKGALHEDLFDRSLKYHEDTLAWWKLISSNKCYFDLGEPVAVYKWTDSNIAAGQWVKYTKLFYKKVIFYFIRKPYQISLKSWKSILKRFIALYAGTIGR